MKNTVYVLSLIIVLGLGGGHPAISHEDQVGHANNSAPIPGANPLIEEMTTLDRIFRDVVSAVVLGNGAVVHKALGLMHGAMEKTHEGIHTGFVTLPKNNERMTEFVRMDKQFHEKLEALADAGRRSNQKEMLSLTKQLLDRCVQCHRIFRK